MHARCMNRNIYLAKCSVNRIRENVVSRTFGATLYFLQPSSSWETSLRLKGLGGKYDLFFTLHTCNIMSPALSISHFSAAEPGVIIFTKISPEPVFRSLPPAIRNPSAPLSFSNSTRDGTPSGSPSMFKEAREGEGRREVDGEGEGRCEGGRG